MFKPFEELHEKLGYVFRDLSILRLALIHKSFGNENLALAPIDSQNNERLEFLGDAVLDLVVSELLLTEFPQSSEGELSKLRASLVNEKILAKIARKISLGDYIFLGKGEENTGGREKDSILSSTLEAIVAAIFRDGGFVSAAKWIEDLFNESIKQSCGDDALQDYKTRLQELVQARYKSAPSYQCIETSGPDHDKTFRVQVLVNGQVLSTAQGKSKKEAEQNSAKIAIECILA